MDGIQILDVRTVESSEESDSLSVGSGRDSDESLSSSSISKKNVAKTYRRPPFSYSMLAALAFKNAKKDMAVSEIYSFIIKHFPYYATAGLAWKNSIRHNLSMHPLFKRHIPEGEVGEGENYPHTTKHQKGMQWSMCSDRIDRMESNLVQAMLTDRPGILASMRYPDDVKAILAGTFADREDDDDEFDTLDVSSDVDEDRQVQPPPMLETPTKRFVITQFGEGVLPLITLYSKTPTDHADYSYRYPVVTDRGGAV